MKQDVLMVSVGGVTNSFGKFSDVSVDNRKDIIHRCVPSNWPGSVSVEHRVGVNVDVFLYHFDGFDASVVMVWEMYRLDGDSYHSVDELADFIGEGIDKEVDAHSEETIWDDDFVEEIIPGACSTERMEEFKTV